MPLHFRGPSFAIRDRAGPSNGLTAGGPTTLCQGSREDRFHLAWYNLLREPGELAPQSLRPTVSEGCPLLPGKSVNHTISWLVIFQWLATVPTWLRESFCALLNVARKRHFEMMFFGTVNDRSLL